MHSSKVVAATLALLACLGCEQKKTTPVGVPKNLVLTTPIFEAGVNDEIERAGSATRLPNGNVAVADIFSTQIKVFDSKGQLIRTVGRKGGGPGEYQAAGWIARCNQDSLFVFDIGLFRMTVLDTAGRVVRQFSDMTPTTGGMACSATYDVHTAFVALGGPNHLDKPGEKPQRTYGDLVLFDNDGDERRRIKNLLLWEGLGPPLTHGGTVAIGREILWYGNADSAYVDKYSLKGKFLGTVALGLERRPVSANDVAQYIDRMVSVFADAQTREANRKLMSRYPVPKWMPWYSYVRADPNDNVWVVTSVRGEPSTVMRVVSKNGEILGNVTIPADFQVFEIGRDYILGAYEKDDQPRVAMYRYEFGR